MKYLIALLLCCSCANTDLAPDEFRVDFGVGESDGDITASSPYHSLTHSTSVESESQWMSVGWTWRLGDVAERKEEADARRDHRDFLLALNGIIDRPTPVVVPQPAPEPKEAAAAPEPKHEQPEDGVPVVTWIALATTVGQAIVIVLNKTGKTDMLSHKSH